MGRKGANNPRQVRSKHCGCRLCLEAIPEPERKRRRDCVGTWQARYRDADGQQKARNLRTKKEADAFLDEVRSSVRKGTYLDPKRGDITLAAWWEKWWPSHKKGRPTTEARKLTSWSAHIEPKWGRRKLNSLTYMEIQDWVSTTVTGHATQTKVMQLLNMMLKAAVRDGRLPFNPAADVETTASPPAKHPDDLKPPTPEQYELIRAHMKPYYRPLLDFAQETGMRWGEYSGLRWCNVDLKEGTATVRDTVVDVHGRLVRQGVPKTNAGFRTVPLSGRAIDAIKMMADVHGVVDARSDVADGMCREELVFRTPDGAVLNRNNFRRFWTTAITEAKVARKVYDRDRNRTEWWPRVHDYRHALASRLHEQNVSERDVQTVLGQERGGRVTWMYTHGSDGAIETVRAAMQGGRHLRAVS